jgi:NAD(P)-dependent dehydrogenase (short-subunit alcohol dehydrogenase family)
VEKRNATVAVVGAGDFIGGEIAKKFASEGFTVFVGRRQGEKLAPLVKEIEAAGGKVFGRALDARKEDEIVSFLGDADKHAPLEVCVFNIGANVNFPIVDTTERVFRKVWEMACYSGFLAGREAARLMLPRGKGNIFFTGATASMRGGSGFAAFASAKFGLRAVAQSIARELGPKNIHVAHLVIDSSVDTEWVRQLIAGREGPQALENLDPNRLMRPAAVAEAYWQLYHSRAMPGPLSTKSGHSERNGKRAHRWNSAFQRKMRHFAMKYAPSSRRIIRRTCVFPIRRPT